MKYFIFLALIGICAFGNLAAVVPHNRPATAAVMPQNYPASNLTQDLNELRLMIPLYSIRQLVTRYLLNDAEFQTFVRIINSNDAYVTQMRFRSQPEVTSFLVWFRTQIMLSGGDSYSAESFSDESDEWLGIINRSPFWSSSVFGWQGFVNEFRMYYPQDAIRDFVQSKLNANGVFAQFIQRLMALKPVYDRVTALPEAQRLSATLQANGIDAVVLDTFIRNLCGWQKTTLI